MIYCAIIVTIGWSMFCEGMPNGDKWLAIIGISLYIFGMISGEIIESRMIKRIKKLEDKVNTDEEKNY